MLHTICLRCKFSLNDHTANQQPLHWGMKIPETPMKPSELRGQASNAKLGTDLTGIARATAKPWRKHHLDYDATKHVVESVRRELGLKPPAQRRRTVERLDRDQIQALIASAYKRSS